MDLFQKFSPCDNTKNSTLIEDGSNMAVTHR